MGLEKRNMQETWHLETIVNKTKMIFFYVKHLSTHFKTFLFIFQNVLTELVFIDKMAKKNKFLHFGSRKMDYLNV